MLQLQDISDWQASWSPPAHLDGVYVKATEGLGRNSYNPDPTMQAKYAVAESHGIPVGYYHFAHPGSSGGAAQAEWFASIVGKYPAQLIPMVDVEVSDGHSASFVSTWCDEYCSTLDGLLGDNGYYCNLDFLRGGYVSSLSARKLWLAHPGMPSWDSVVAEIGSTGPKLVLWQSGQKGIDADQCPSLAPLLVAKGTPENMDLTPQNLEDIANAVWTRRMVTEWAGTVEMQSALSHAGATLSDFTKQFGPELQQAAQNAGTSLPANMQQLIENALTATFAKLGTVTNS